MQGTLLNQRYQIIKILGAGGFGQTYLAKDLRFPDSEPCVVKQFKPASTDTSFLEVARRLFDTEAKILERLGQHELIPTFIDSFEEQKEFYLVQEFIDGTALSDMFTDGVQFTEPEAIEFLNDILSVLDFVHRKDVIHRDVKPENIIRRHGDGRYVLIDFGAVKEKQYQLATQTRMTNLTGMAAPEGNSGGQPDDKQTSPLTVGIGTEGYTPHEQLSGRPRHSSDIYALGVTTIQAITGMQPYEWGDDPDTGELQWQEHAFTSLGFSLILETMVRFNIKHRYRNASEVVSDLKKLATLPDEYTTIPDPERYVGRDGMARHGARAMVPSGLFANKIKPRTTTKSRWSKFKPLGIMGAATLVMGGLLLGVRQLGWLQPLELATFDRLMQLRSNFGPDPRLVVVEITEADLRELQQPTPSDANVTQVLQALEDHNPSVVGIGLYRDLPQGPKADHQRLSDEIQASQAIAMTFLGQGDDHIPPPPGLPNDLIGFGDLTTDVDGVLRRNVLIGRNEDGPIYSFSFQLATRYLAQQAQAIVPDSDPQNPDQMLLGATSLPRLAKHSGQYQTLEDGGYQIMLDYRAPQQAARTIRFTDILDGNFNPEWITDNIVLIGTTASSSRDRFLTPYSANQQGEESDEKMSSVIIHAQMVSQLLDIAIGDRTLRWYWPEGVEVLWIMGWALAGSSLAYFCRHPILLGGGGIVLVLTISGVSFVLFGQGGWIPTLTPAIAALLTGGATVACRAYITQKNQDLLSDFLHNSRLHDLS